MSELPIRKYVTVQQCEYVTDTGNKRLIPYPHQHMVEQDGRQYCYERGNWSERKYEGAVAEMKKRKKEAYQKEKEEEKK